MCLRKSRITEKDISRLRKWEIESVQTAGSVIDEEEERKTKEQTIHDLKESRTYKELLQIYLAAIKTDKCSLCDNEAGKKGHHQGIQQGSGTAVSDR